MSLCSARLRHMSEVDRAHDQPPIIRMMVSQFAPADVHGLTPDTRLVEDLGYHSLALLELAFALEDEFDLPPLDAETAANILTVGDVEDLVAQRLSTAERSADAG
jgi:acyl carrier protein